MKKRDMYIRYDKTNSENKRRKRRIKKTLCLVIPVVLITAALVLLWRAQLLPSFDGKKTEDSVKSPETEKEGSNIVQNGDNAVVNEGDEGSTDVKSTDGSNIEEKGAGAKGPETKDTETKGIETKNTDVNGTEDITDNTGSNPAPETDSEEAFTNTQKPLTDEIEKSTEEPVRGIYVSGAKAGIDSYMSELVQLADETEINAMVIDIKNDMGEITYKMDQPLVEEIGAGVGYVKDMKGLVRQLKEKNIYLIARVVAFKDPLLAAKKEDFSLKKKNGKVFKDKNGDRWVNPYNKEVWDYLVAVAEEAASLGFDEIQFDYIRFSTDSGMKEVDFGPEAENKSKIEAITEFTKYACDKLKPLGVKVSADVYGTIIDSKVDAGIVGQDYAAMAGYLDYISPMIYPSHYGEGSFGIDYPDTKPYDTILAALKKSREVLKKGDENAAEKTAEVRPWLQDFTATWVKHHINYGKDEIKAQIQAVYDAGYTEWILWNGSNNYTKTAFEKN